ncbi:uncharacterized protein LOC133897300 [Phragmites australis]|uniref:uncharacterized protein LOC133897300 n=1 Tax=Phragmites australis TaxID=29695 RepID=UPI002D774E87|nr:uncharacterized protein LOC133897300 [Phragmites australis]
MAWVLLAFKMCLKDVFIHDPLYKWPLSSLKALQRQKCFYQDEITQRLRKIQRPDEEKEEWKETDDTDSYLDYSQKVCEGNKDAAVLCSVLNRSWMDMKAVHQTFF